MSGLDDEDGLVSDVSALEAVAVDPQFVRPLVLHGESDGRPGHLLATRSGH